LKQRKNIGLADTRWIDFAFLLNHPFTSYKQSAQHRSLGALDFEDREIGFHGVATCVRSSSGLNVSGKDNHPIIVLYISSSAILPPIGGHLGGPENGWRMSRLLECPLWIYIDLVQACGNWSDVWEVARRDLARRDAQAHQEIARPPILQLTRRLHRGNSNVITLRENLRLHISSMERFQHYAQGGAQSLSLPITKEHQKNLEDRTMNLLQDLQHHWETSGVILEQLKTLLSLVSAYSISNRVT
jgi:hypothetical protein